MKSFWIRRSRVWRLALLMNEDGSWDPTVPGLAFPLAARRIRPQETEHLRKKKVEGMHAGLLSAAVEGEMDFVGQDHVDGLIGREVSKMGSASSSPPLNSSPRPAPLVCILTYSQDQTVVAARLLHS